MQSQTTSKRTFGCEFPNFALNQSSVLGADEERRLTGHPWPLTVRKLKLLGTLLYAARYRSAA